MLQSLQETHTKKEKQTTKHVQKSFFSHQNHSGSSPREPLIRSGWMKSLNPNIDGVTGQESNPISTTDPNSDRVNFGNGSEYVDPDPPHSFQAIYAQVFGDPWSASASSASNYKAATMEGFAEQAEATQKGMSETVMNGFRPESIPVYKELVMEFGVCDRWFASLPASTQPNRLFLHSATSNGAMSNDTKKLIDGYPQKTIFE